MARFLLEPGEQVIHRKRLAVVGEGRIRAASYPHGSANRAGIREGQSRHERAPREVGALGGLLRIGEKHVVLAGHIEEALGVHALRISDGVEGPGLLTVRLIAVCRTKGGRRPQRVDTVDDLLQRRRGILVGFALEADVVSLIWTKLKLARSGV